MKTLRTLMIAWLALGAALLAQTPGGAPKAAPQKSPTDLEADAFFKLRDDKTAKLDDERFKKLIAVGFEFIEKNPTHGRTAGVVNGLANFGDTITDKNAAMYRSNFRGLLKFAIIDERDKDGLSPEARTAVAALEAAAQDVETRAEFNRDSLDTLREKIDRLTPMPGSGRFLVDRERSYVEILTKGVNPTAAERHLKKMTQHADKGVAAWAQTDLNIIEIKKAPYELKFTALDGKACDLASLRGKAVALVFFSAGNEGSVKALTTLKELQSDYKRDLHVVAVSFDKAEDRAKVEAVVKTTKFAGPVHFDGKEAKNDWAPKLNVTRVPAIALFDAKGILVTNNLRADRFEGELKRVLGVKDTPAPQQPSASSSKKRR